MAQSKKLENLIKQKNNLTDSVELCCNSISFWEKRANKIFKQMDSFEDEIKPDLEKPQIDSPEGA